jgi:hypothetical protein
MSGANSELPALKLSDHASAIGSISEESLFLTLPTRGLTGQEIMPSEG